MTIPLSAVEESETERRLLQLELNPRELQEAMLVGYTAAAGCTDHDPRSLPGTLAWGRAVGHLRDLTKPRGWTADRSSNYETAVHPSNAHCVAVAAGTRETGRSTGVPRTRTPKGPATSRVVTRNAQLPLGHGTDVFAGAGVARVEDEGRETWLLLHFYDREDDEIRLELSCPSEMSGSQITAWRERLLIDPVPFSEDVEVEEFDEPELPIDIDVPRRTK
jgi:hypothetical protein